MRRWLLLSGITSLMANQSSSNLLINERESGGQLTRQGPERGRCPGRPAAPGPPPAGPAPAPRTPAAAPPAPASPAPARPIRTPTQSHLASPPAPASHTRARPTRHTCSRLSFRPALFSRPGYRIAHPSRSGSHSASTLESFVPKPYAPCTMPCCSRPASAHLT